MARKKFQPIEISTKDPTKIFDTHKIEISKAIINAIEYGLRYKKEKVDFAFVNLNNILIITLSVDNKEFSDLIDDNLKTLIEFEEYETCALAVKLKNKINKNRLCETNQI